MSNSLGAVESEIPADWNLARKLPDPKDDLMTRHLLKSTAAASLETQYAGKNKVHKLTVSRILGRHKGDMSLLL